jgi:nucleotide-binding universal stress UspA family protein
MRIRTVLCPIDFSGLDEGEIAVASEVCRAFGATLVLHHNLAAAEPGFSRAWEWTKAHEGHEAGIPEAERRLRRLVERVGRDVHVEAAITSGPVGQVVLSLAQGLDVDVIVLGSHGWSTQDHASVTERLVDEAPCPVLTFQEGVADPRAFRLAAVGEHRLRAVVPTDLTRNGSSALAYACALARALPLELDLLHVITSDQSTSAALAERALDGHVPPDLVDRVRAHVRTGTPAEAIVAYAAETMPAFLVLGEHARGLVRRLLTRDTTRAVMRAVGCPVWVVPWRVRV